MPFKRTLLLFILLSVLLIGLGENPLHVFYVLFNSAFGSFENFSYTIYYATPLLLTGLSVQLALRTGIFNIGAEGQLYMGAVFCAFFTHATIPHFLHQKPNSMTVFLFIFLASIFSFIGGALWASIAAVLKVFRQTHEVLSCILLNFIAMAISNWAILNPLKNLETQNLETIPLPEVLRIPRAFLHTTWSFPIVIFIVLFTFWILEKTWIGFKIRATGLNLRSATYAGIQTKKLLLILFLCSGGIAGLVGFQEIYLNSYKLLDGFSQGQGFTGLVVALMANLLIKNFNSRTQNTTLSIFIQSIALIFSALFFGALYKGSLDLDLETEKINRDFSIVLQAILLLSLFFSSPKTVEQST